MAAALMLAAATASAQLYLGGSIGLNREPSDNQTTFTIAPELGYNFNEQWAVGGTLDFTHLYTDGMSTNLFSIEPYARYSYFTYDRVRLFVDGGFGVGFGKSKEGDYKSDTYTVYNIGFRPGVAFDINEKAGLVAHFGFLGYQGGNDAAKESGLDVAQEKFGFDFSSMNLQLGFYINF